MSLVYPTKLAPCQVVPFLVVTICYTNIHITQYWWCNHKLSKKNQYFPRPYRHDSTENGCIQTKLFNIQQKYIIKPFFYIYRRSFTSVKFNFNSKAILDIKTFLFSFLFGYSLTRILYNPIILHQWSFIGYKQTSLLNVADFNWKTCTTPLQFTHICAQLSIYFSVEWV